MILGITGISGAGKHTAAQLLERKGWKVVDADQLAHFLYRPYTVVWKAIVASFGEAILNQDDSINRGKLGKIVFNPEDPAAAAQALRRLNEAVHPPLRRRLEDEIHHLSRKGKPIAVVAALWKELDLKGLCQKLLWVRAQPALARERIQRRDGISAQEYALRIRQQRPPRHADWVLENNGKPEEFQKRLLALLGL